MVTEYIATSSALLVFNLPSGPQFMLYLSYGGTPDKVKEALRRACSHRRTMVVARTSEYLFNVIGHLHRMLPQDAGAIWLKGKSRFHYMRATAAYRYYIGITDKTPIITWGSEKHEDLTEPFFRWLGSEWHRPIAPRPPRTGKARGGRPSNLRKERPELFTNLPKQSASKEQSGIPLGLKHKRKIHVDFTGVESVDRSRGERISLYEDAALGDEYEHELDLLYGTESGAQP